METERQSNVIAAVFHRGSGYYSDKKYHYFCKYPVRVGDHVIVDSPYNGYTCVKVVDILPKGSMKATKPVIQVVDDSEYLADLKRQQRMAEIERQLEKRAKEYSKRQLYRQLAQMDPVAKELYAELEQLVA